jgi:hypothetical protein
MSLLESRESKLFSLFKAHASSAGIDPSRSPKEYFSKDEIKRRMEEDRERVQFFIGRC